MKQKINQSKLEHLFKALGVLQYDLKQDGSVSIISTYPPLNSIGTAEVRTAFQGHDIIFKLLAGIPPVQEDEDMVNSPPHYASGKIEVIEAIEDWKLNYHRGQVVKYTARAGKKDPTKELEDLEKATWYLKREIEILKAMTENRAALKPNLMNQSAAIKAPISATVASVLDTHDLLADSVTNALKTVFTGEWTTVEDGDDTEKQLLMFQPYDQERLASLIKVGAETTLFGAQS